MDHYESQIIEKLKEVGTPDKTIEEVISLINEMLQQMAWDSEEMET